MNIVSGKCAVAMSYHYYPTILNRGPQSLIQNSGGQMGSRIQNFGGSRKLKQYSTY